MNGRVYDPVVGIFVSPDPWIQDPENSQSYNRYSYVWNNPLRYTDPTGEQADDVNRHTGCGTNSSCTYIQIAGGSPINAGAGTQQNAGAPPEPKTRENTGQINATGTPAETVKIPPPSAPKQTGDTQQSVVKKQEAGAVNTTVRNLGVKVPIFSVSSERDAGEVEEVMVCKTRSGGECGGGRNKWTAADFFKHYAFGFGALVDLRGTGGDFRNSRSVLSATRSFEQEVMQGPVFNLSTSDTAKINVTNDGDIGSPDLFPFNTPSIFSIGDSSLSMR